MLEVSHTMVSQHVTVDLADLSEVPPELWSQHKRYWPDDVTPLTIQPKSDFHPYMRQYLLKREAGQPTGWQFV